ncbi:hypothetical protein AA637_03950 [Cyanobacterium sp. HL-69]|uniref:hypothetical protein n=1 Tax=Cyanobacterium sp. HL-69 TaxID=2054282 RepID=UPI000CA0B455|nr:hypothetical protein AA637_03950 [Cyanobacterium sp. HL-69]
MLPIITRFLEDYYVYLKPLYFVGAWLLLFLLVASILRGVRDAVKRSQAMHEIPCTNCQYFTNDYRLKCTIQPNIANTELAKDCPDFMVEESW